MEETKQPILTIILLHKPYGFLSQFSPEARSQWRTLSDLLTIPNVYPVGRLDADSEGLLILTNIGRLQQRLTDPRFGHWRNYLVQVEGCPNEYKLEKLRKGLKVKNRMTLPARAKFLEDHESLNIPNRDPPIRFRASIPTKWIELSIREGRNRQVRRMTAAIGHPTLRLIRFKIDLMDGEPALTLANIATGNWRMANLKEEKRLTSLIKNF